MIQRTYSMLGVLLSVCLSYGGCSTVEPPSSSDTIDSENEEIPEGDRIEPPVLGGEPIGPMMAGEMSTPGAAGESSTGAEMVVKLLRIRLVQWSEKWI